MARTSLHYAMLVTTLTMIPAQNEVFRRAVFAQKLFFSISITADDAVKPVQWHMLEPSQKAAVGLCTTHKYLGG